MAYQRTFFSHGFHVSPEQDKNHLRYTYLVRAPRYRVIVFKGGGGRVWVYKKFLHMLDENALIDDVKEYGGSSAGAMFAVLAAMPLKYKDREKLINNMKFHRDILDDSTGSRYYRKFTWPLYIISKPLDWLAQGFSWLAEQCHKVRYGFMPAGLFYLFSGVIKLTSMITHPLALAGFYNLLSKGGIYRGNEMQNYIKKSLNYGTTVALENFINHTHDPKKQTHIINKLLSMHDLILNIKKNPKTQKYKVTLNTDDITFGHFHQLSQLKGSGFKDVFLTATRCQPTRRGRLKILNHTTTPHKPLHLAVRISMSAPLLYQPVHDHGRYYMDGGCADNFPIQHGSKRNYANRFEKHYLTGKYGQDLDVLGVRVEYKQDLGIFHEPIQIVTSFWGKFKTRAQEWIFNLICGMDIYKPESKVLHVVKKKYPHRVLQLYDHGVGFTEVDIDDTRKHQILQCEEASIQQFMDAHNKELTHVENYHAFAKRGQPNEDAMSRKQQKKFLQFLHKKTVPDDEIFSMAFSAEEAARCREDLIKELTVSLKGTGRGF